MRQNCGIERAYIYLLLWACLAVTTATADTEEPPGFLLKWGSLGTTNGRFQDPVDIAVDFQGNVYVVDAGNNRMQKFDGSGTFITKWGRPGTWVGEFGFLHAVAIGADGFVYTLESRGYPGLDRLQRFTAEGAFDSFLPLDPMPLGLGIDSGGFIYVSFLSVGAEVRRLDPHGRLVTTWNLDVNGTGRFINPDGLGIADGDGIVYVTDTSNNEILRFDTTGVFKGKWQMPAADISVDAQQNVYVVRRDHVEKYNSDGMLLSSWGKQGAGDGEFDDACAIAVDSNAGIYVLDRGNQRVQKFGRPVNVESSSWSRFKMRFR